MKTFNDSLHNLIYNNDASHLPQNEDVEVFIPENNNEIIEIVNKAVNENKKILCRGGGTNLVGNCLPGKNTIIVDLSKLNKIIEKTDKYVLVQPGLTNDQLNENIKEDGLYFPVVLGSHAGAEIGGMIATNGAGMRAIKYGKMEKRVEELNILIVNKNKKVELKTIEGKDINDYLGSEGKLGIILQAKLKIIKKSKERSIDFESFENIEEALEYKNKIKNNPYISALEIINPQVAEYLNLEKKYYILVEYENNETGKIKEKDDIEKIWKYRDSCYAVTINAGFDQIEDPEIHSNEGKFFKRFEKKNIPIFGHIGIGVLHPHFKSGQKELVNEMYEIVNKSGGKVSGEHGIGKKKEEYLSEDYINEKQKLKDKRDPNNIFGF